MYWNNRAGLAGTGNIWLIVTWDVLKRQINIKNDYEVDGLIVTWDVLKPLYRGIFKMIKVINSNIRCIETAIVELLVYLQIRLIVTWDVLKLTKPEYKELPSTD